MRLPFQPFTTQDVPQYAVARPQQMPQLPQPIGPSPETASMFARQLEGLGQTIIESTAQIAKPYVVDANEAERERKRAELATKNKIVLDFEGALAGDEKAALRSTQLDPRAYKEKNYAKEFKSKAVPFLAKALRDYGIEPESTLAKEIENSLIASAQERARSLDRSDVAAIANQIQQADQEAEDAAFRSLDYYYIKKVEEIASEKAKSGLELTPEDYDEAYAYAYSEAEKSVNQISDEERQRIVRDKLITVGGGRTNQQKIEYHSTLVKNKEREEAEQDASNINDAAIAMQVALDEKISELSDDPNSEISAQEAFGDYLNEDGTPNKKAIEELIDKKEISFLNPETSRVRAIAEMASIVQRYASARNRADYETKKQNFVETQNRAKLDAIAEADRQAEGLIEQLENSPFKGTQIANQYYEIAATIAKKYGGEDPQLAADIERSINAHFRTDRRAAIGSAAKYDSTGKELDFLEEFNNLLENTEYSSSKDFYRDPKTGERVGAPIGFKPYVEYLLRRAEEDPDNYPLVEVIKLINDRREKTRGELKNKANELFGDDSQSIQRVMIEVNKNLNGIEADAEKKLAIASKANEEALNNVSRSLAVNTAIDRVFLELKEQELTPSQAVSKFDELIRSALDEATKGMNPLDAALFKNEFGDSTRAKRISLQEDALRETQKETRVSAINLLDNQLREDGPWTDEEYLSKKESVTATISKLVFLTEEEQAALQAERMKLLDTADARMMVKTDPESALNLLRPQANGKYSKDRFAFIDPSVRNSLISTAEAVLNSGVSVSQKQKKLKNAIGTALEAMNPLEQNGGMLNIDPSILELAEGLDEADRNDVFLEFEFLKQLGEAVGTDLTLSEKLAGMPDAELDKFSNQFSHIRFQKEEGQGRGDSRILETHSDALNALIKNIRTERNKNPSRHHWRRLRATSGNESASYFDSEAQRAVMVNQILLNPNLKEVRVLDNEFVDRSKDIWANGVPSGALEWDTKTFTSEQNIIDIRKQMASEMLKSPRAMQELVQNGVTSYVELQMYVEMSGSELYAITRGAEGGKAETNRKILEASGEKKQVLADAFIFQNEEIAKIVNSYDFEDQEDLKLMIRQYIAGQDTPDFEDRIANAAKAFSLGSRYAVANTNGVARQGTVKLPSEFDASRTGSVLSNSGHVKTLIQNLIVFGANGEPTKVDATANFVGYVESNQPWRWSNFTSAAGEEVEALAIEILDNNGVYQKISMNGKTPVLTFQQLEKYMSSKDRNISFDEDIVEAAKQIGAQLTKLDDMEEFNKIMRDAARGGTGRKPTPEEVKKINERIDRTFRFFPEFAVEMYENSAEWFKEQIRPKWRENLNRAQ